MKLYKLFISLLFLFYIKGVAQVKVGADGAIHPTGIYPSAISKEIFSNTYRVRDITERNAIPLIFRDTGMIAHVTEDSTNYQLQGGISNSNWTLLTSNGSNLKVDSLTVKYGNIIDTLVYWVNGISKDWYYINVRDGLISGGNVIYTGFNKDYFISAATYRKGGVFYFTNDTIITVNSLINADSSRTDLFIVNTNSEVTVKEGIESSDPLTPQADPETEIALTTITLTPTNTEGLNISLIYDENIEWTGGTLNGATTNFGANIEPYKGLLHTDVNTISNNQMITYTTGGSLDKNDYDGVIMFIKLKAPLIGSSKLRFIIRMNNTNITNEVVIPVNATNTTTYQPVTISFSGLTWNSNNFNNIRIRYTTGTHDGFYVDYVYLQKGVIPPSISDDVILTGDITGVGVTGLAISTTLSNTGVVAGTYGATDSVGQFTVDAKGRLSFSQNVAIAKTDTANLSYRIDTVAANIPDTTSLSNRINLKVNISDTATMFGGYIKQAYRTVGIDTIYFIRGDNSVFGVKDSTGAGGSTIAVDTIYRKAGQDSIFFTIAGGAERAIKDSVGSGGGIAYDTLAIRKIGPHYVGFNSGVGQNGTFGGSRLPWTNPAVDSGNIFIGRNAGGAITSGWANIGIGFQALASLTTSSRQIAIGDFALSSLTTGGASESNTAIGFRALQNNNSVRNFAFGSGAAQNYTGQRVTAIGYNALNLNSTGTENVAVGYLAGGSVTTGAKNTYLGATAGLSSTGSANVFLGHTAGRSVTGNQNVAIGASSSVNSETMRGAGNANSVAVGSSAMLYNNSSQANFIGADAGRGASGTPHTGAYNNGFGYRANYDIGGAITGASNTVIGDRIALPSRTSSNQFVFGINGINYLTRFTGGGWLVNNTGSAVTTQEPSAALQINGTTGGLLIPRLTSAQRVALSSPANGLIVYDTDSTRIMQRRDAAWQGYAFTAETGGSGGGGGGGSFVTNSKLGADVTMALTNTWYTGATVTLPDTGTYVITGYLTVQRQTTTAQQYQARIAYDDASVILASTAQYQASVNPGPVNMHMTTTVYVTTATTIVIQAATSTSTNNIIKSNLSINDQGANATQLTAYKVN